MMKQTALVTGASSGIELLIANRLHQTFVKSTLEFLAK
jgi:NAD(P)-dependent dehydrogenase (short-subunit alcohol dehydrogenase family)